MPDALIYEDEVERFETHGEWFDLKRKMSYGDRRRLEQEFVVLGAQIGKGEVPTEAARPLLLLLSIKAWSIKDREGKPASVDEENIDRLDHSLANKLIAEVNRRNPAPKVPALTKKSGPPSKSSTKKDQGK